MTTSGVIGSFDRWARDRPGALAVSDDQGRWTYGELAAASRRIASALATEPSPSPRPVGVLLGHDRIAVAGILGVLCAGGIVVPLNSSEPEDYLAGVLELTGADIVLCDARRADLAANLARQRGLRVVHVEDASVGPERAWNGEVRGDDPCYLLLTSGSTGLPKAVVDTHERILHDTSVFVDEVSIRADDRLAWFGSYSLGAQTLIVFAALLSGASLHIYHLRERGVASLSTWLRKEGVSVASLVPSAVRSWTTVLGEPESLPDLRMLVATGEPLFRSDVELIRRHLPRDCRLMNIFGLTELKTVGYLEINRDGEVPWAAIPVRPHGRRQQLFLIDSQGGEDAPSGELAIATDPMTPGYWRQGAIVQPSPPFATSAAHGRYYRTGDLARIDADGLLHISGRSDFQVKLRGHRIELEHVEGALLAHPAITAAAAALRRTASGREVLAAFYVCRPSEALESDALRAFLRRRLPGAMIPTRLIALAQLPVGPSGKLDRKQLPELNDPVVEAAELPADPVEAQLLEWWRAQLEAPRARVTDDFFELGGDSLAAAEFFAKVEARFGVDLPISTLLEASTVEQIAAILRTGGREPNWPVVVPLRAGRDRPVFFCVPGAGFDPLSLAALSAALGPDQPMSSFRPLGDSGSEVLSIEEIAARYFDSLRQLDQVPRILGGSSFGGLVAFEMALQLQRDGAPPLAVVLLDTYGPGYPNARAAVGVRAIAKRTLQRLLHLAPFERISLSLLQREGRYRLNLLRSQWRSAGARLRRQQREHHRYFDLIGRHVAAASRYVPGQAFSTPTFLFRTAQPLDLSLYWADETLGWSPFAPRLEVIPISGTHYDFSQASHAATLGRQLQDVLDRVVAEERCGLGTSIPPGRAA